MKKIITKIKLQIKTGEANPSPPIGPALGSKGINIMKFCNEFNENSLKINDLDKGTIVPVIVTIYSDKSFTFIIKTPPASILIKKFMNKEKGSKSPKKEIIGNINIEKIKEIAKIKEKDLLVNSEEAAIKTIIGTAKSIGIEIDGE